MATARIKIYLHRITHARTGAQLFTKQTYCYRHNLDRPGGGPRSKMGSKDNYSGLANRPLRGRLRPGMAIYLDRCVRLKII
jgi:hypothetical protein